MAVSPIIASAADNELDRSRVVALFERFKKLEGTWQGKSTKGWEDRMVMKVMARGTVIMETSEFVDEPEEGMASMYHLDGDRLLLTHYCEAGNVPVLQVTRIENEGNTITFDFKSGFNMSSRDIGHMDKMVFHWIDEDHFSSQWSWYKEGKQTWFEDIQYVRIKQK